MIRVMRGMHGKPDHFLAVCVENRTEGRAMSLAPYLLSQATALMLEEKRGAKTG